MAKMWPSTIEARKRKKRVEAVRVRALWYPRPKKRNAITKDEEGKQRVCKLYQEGFTLRELSGWFWTSYETIRQILLDNNVLRRPSPHAASGAGTKIGKEMVVGGYVKVFVGIGYPGAPQNGWMFKHRFVMQKHLNRVLMPWELVHHIDRDKLHNDRLNLTMTSRTDHPTCVACPYYRYYVEQTGNSEFGKEKT